MVGSGRDRGLGGGREPQTALTDGWRVALRIGGLAHVDPIRVRGPLTSAKNRGSQFDPEVLFLIKTV